MSSSSTKVMSSRSSSAAENSLSDATLLDMKIAQLDASEWIVDPTTTTSSRSVDEVWLDIVSGEKRDSLRPKEEAPDAAVMTLEDFLLAKTALHDKEFPFPASAAGGRGKRSRGAVEAVDKAAQQRQRRMIKNRESAARSRERKQAYQVELESLAVKLEEDHSCLLTDKVERTKERFKQLMENVFPVEEKRRPRRVLRRVRSFECWLKM